MSDKNEDSIVEKTNLSRNMHVLSASSVSLHSYAASHRNENKPRQSSNSKTSILYFLALFYAFFCMGMGTGLIGPTLLKFGEQMNTSLEQVVYLLFTRSAGFLAGTLIGGALIDQFASSGRTLLTCAIFFMCSVTMIIPFLYHLIPMICAHLAWSLCAGVVDNLAQILTIRHYEHTNFNPYLQALHGAFGVGALISPLIIAPFLQKSSAAEDWHYAYWLIGLFHIPNVIWILVYAVRDECCSKKIRRVDLDNREAISEGILPSNEPEKTSDALSRRTLFFLILVTTFLLLYVGAESAFGAYLHTYASLHLHFEKDIAAYLNSLFWAAFAFGRMCGIPLSMKFSPLQMIFADLIGCIISLSFLFILNHSSIALWIGSISYGLSVASIYPSAIAYTETHVPITGKRMSALAVGGSAGDAIIPLLIGYSISPQGMGPIGFIVIPFIVAVLASLLFVFIVLYMRFQPKPEEIQNETK